MATSVFLHIGLPKTGTTYLQDVLWDNRAALAEKGVLLPGGRRFAAFHATQAIREVRRLAELSQEKQDVWPSMLSEIAAHRGSAILSHEFLASASHEQAQRAIHQLGPADVHVVLTARDYVSQLPALWQETVKMGNQQSLTKYVEAVLADSRPGPWGRRSVDILDVLDRWTATIPSEHVHLVTVPPPSSEPGLLWERFARACQLPPTDLDPPERRSNPSLTAEAVLLLQRIATALPDAFTDPPTRYQWLRGYLAHSLLAHRGTTPTRLDAATAVTVREWGESTIRALAQTDIDVIGNLQDLVSTPLSNQRPPEVGADALLDVAVALISDVVDQQRLAPTPTSPHGSSGQQEPPPTDPAPPEPKRRAKRWTLRGRLGSR